MLAAISLFDVRSLSISPIPIRISLGQHAGSDAYPGRPSFRCFPAFDHGSMGCAPGPHRFQRAALRECAWENSPKTLHELRGIAPALPVTP